MAVAQKKFRPYDEEAMYRKIRRDAWVVTAIGLVGWFVLRICFMLIEDARLGQATNFENLLSWPFLDPFLYNVLMAVGALTGLVGVYKARRLRVRTGIGGSFNYLDIDAPFYRPFVIALMGAFLMELLVWGSVFPRIIQENGALSPGLLVSYGLVVLMVGALFLLWRHMKPKYDDEAKWHAKWQVIAFLASSFVFYRVFMIYFYDWPAWSSFTGFFASWPAEAWIAMPFVLLWAALCIRFPLLGRLTATVFSVFFIMISLMALIIPGMTRTRD